MKRVEKLKLKCITCGEELLRYPSQSNNGRVFCNHKCLTESKKNGSWLECGYCGAKFYRRFGEQRRAIKFFCSKICYSNDRTENMKDTTYIKRNGVHIHITIAEKYLGRKLLKGEIVHHINMDKHNNTLENLAILPSQKYHADVHFGKREFEQYRLSKMAVRETKEGTLFKD